MKVLIIVGAALLSVGLAAPAGARALSRPDACKAQHPYANCLNTGRHYGRSGYYARSHRPALRYGAHAAPSGPYARYNGHARGTGY